MVFATYLFISAAYHYDFILEADAISSSIVTVTKFSNLIGSILLFTRQQSISRSLIGREQEIIVALVESLWSIRVEAIEMTS